MRNEKNPFWRKFKILMPRDFFPWVVASGCFEDGEAPYLHAQGCQRNCGKGCNEKGVVMGKLVKGWKDGSTCQPKSWWDRKPRFRFDDLN
jgi:hypothetical protein